MPKPVLVIGDINADLILTELDAAPQPGREVLAGGCALTLGGSSAIFAAGVGALGYPVAFVGKVGRDEIGDLMLKLLRDRRVDVSGVSRGGRTGITVSISHPTDRALVTFGGTIGTTRRRDLDIPKLSRFAHLHMAGYFLQEALRPDVPSILSDAKKAGLTTSLDPGWDPAQKWDVPLRHVDVLFVNEAEFAAMRPTGVETIVVKMGAQGARVNGTRAAAPKVRAIDTTGAGDTFDAGFVVARLRGESIEEALALGNACGALSTLAPGGYAGQPSMRSAAKKRLRVS